MSTLTADDLVGLRRRLVAFCYQTLGSPLDAEDAVQDVMERAWRSGSPSMRREHCCRLTPEREVTP